MEILGMIRWIALGIFVLLFYLSELKKKEEFAIPAHLAFFVTILLHAIVRDWYLIVKIVIILAAIIGIGGNILVIMKKRKKSFT